jgi:hypothetical protein
MPTDEAKAVRAAVDQWFDVLNAMLNGDPKPFAALYSHKDDVTYVGAEGTYRTGWQATYADWTAQAEKSTGGKVAGADIRVVADMATPPTTPRAPSSNPTGRRRRPPCARPAYSAKRMANGG